MATSSITFWNPYPRIMPVLSEYPLAVDFGSCKVVVESWSDRKSINWDRVTRWCETRELGSGNTLITV